VVCPMAVSSESRCDEDFLVEKNEESEAFSQITSVRSDAHGTCTLLVSGDSAATSTN
jgi:hypothetical protein